MAIHVTPIPRLTTLTTPAFTLGTANGAGDALTAVASNSTLLAFDGTTPAAVAAAGVVGSATVAARRDHVHASVSGAITTVDNNIARYTGTAGALQGYTSGGPTIGDTGIMLQPGQPCVLAYNSATDSNVTGGGTTATIDFDSELWDFNGDFASDTFTAPVTGKYKVNLYVNLSGITSDMDLAYLALKPSNREWGSRQYNPGGIMDGANNVAEQISATVDMDASDTMTFTVLFGGGSDVADINGSASTYMNTFVGIELVA